MKDDWTLYCFGDEEVEITKHIYKNDFLGNLAGDGCCSIYGEVRNLISCIEAVDNRRIFSFRIRYEPK